MVIRRRPLARAAVVGGTAYVAGKGVAAREAETKKAQEQAEEAQKQAQQAQMQAAAAPPPAPAKPSQDRIDQLSKLAALHDSGALTDAEYESEKQRLLAS